MPDRYIITIKQKVRPHGRMHPAKFQLDQIQNLSTIGHYLFLFSMIFDKPCQIARPLL